MELTELYNRRMQMSSVPTGRQLLLISISIVEASILFFFLDDTHWPEEC